mmetsp:Transcript_34392/g.92074  ORF Transcript_34392/g.92074 Transcript_34392/m.92074 type:complete len:378 (+) Transcript_34392:286-1419(+)
MSVRVTGWHVCLLSVCTYVLTSKTIRARKASKRWPLSRTPVPCQTHARCEVVQQEMRHPRPRRHMGCASCWELHSGVATGSPRILNQCPLAVGSKPHVMFTQRAHWTSVQPRLDAMPMVEMEARQGPQSVARRKSLQTDCTLRLARHARHAWTVVARNRWFVANAAFGEALDGNDIQATWTFFVIRVSQECAKERLLVLISITQKNITKRCLLVIRVTRGVIVADQVGQTDQLAEEHATACAIVILVGDNNEDATCCRAVIAHVPPSATRRLITYVGVYSERQRRRNALLTQARRQISSEGLGEDRLVVVSIVHNNEPVGRSVPSQTMLAAIWEMRWWARTWLRPAQASSDLVPRPFLVGPWCLRLDYVVETVISWF